jgi:hypothetical protein
MLWQIQSSYFVAGIYFINGKCTHVAPIIKYMKVWNLEKILQYCISKNWNAILVSDEYNQINFSLI